ncbi:MAG: prepilin peptidase [Patescibacteria group bacterium]
MTIHLQVFIFVFGTIIGSFLNAVIWRLRTRESFMSGRSYCPHCRHVLAPVDLMPIVSFLLLRGRCRYCSVKISCSYVIVEMTVGLLFLLAALSLIGTGTLDIPVMSLARLLLVWYLIAIFAIVFVFDLKYMLILRSVTFPAAIIALAGNIALGMDFWRPLAGMAVCAGFFHLQYVLSRGKWIGGGDVQLGLLMGAALGFPGVLVAMLLAYVSGALVGVGLLAGKKKGWKSELPFGTFLAAASVLVLLYGDSIVRWYFSLI